MSDDDDIDYLESLLDAPFKNDSNGKRSSKSPVVESKKSKDKDKERNRDNRSSHKSSRHRSRSRSKERRRKDKDSKNEEKSKKDRKRSKERDREDRKKLKSPSRDREERRRFKSSSRDFEERQKLPRPSPDRPEKRKLKSKSRDPADYFKGAIQDRYERLVLSQLKPKGDRKRRSKSRDAEKPRRDMEDRKRAGGGSRGEKKHSKSPDRKRRRSFSPRPFRRGRTPPNGLGYRDDSPPEDLSPEERDARTIFCMQLSQRVRARDLEEFFSSVGKVKDVRLITCNKTKRFKGIAYIEFKDPESVALALGLSGQRLLGVPISVQHTQAEKNRLANANSPPSPPKNIQGPMRLYVGSLHFNITEEMLRGIFEPFGKIDNIQLIMDTETGRSKGYGFITYHNADDAKKALEQLNGFELAGRPMKVGNVTERLDVTAHASLDTDEMDRSGIDLGATGRLQLMFKLAEGAGLAVPQAAANALLASVPQPPPPIVEEMPQIATQCFLLVNMFDAATETNSSWDQEIQDDVVEECNKHGGVLHIYVDVASDGKVYVKCPSIATAVLAVNALHGRWFAGRVITAAYVPLVTYHSMFPDALAANNLLQLSRKP